MENNDYGPKPNNYMVVAIVCTVLCCLPAGIGGIIYASKVNEHYASGNYEAAESASKNAKLLSFIGIGVGFFFMALMMILAGIPLLSREF